ncbi:hypothetical protein E9549_03610 [Blastococcus sp. MG754426]|uniref:hypothetical protein n=1 Tax=unclassified Blastococcus TaxID=2619396 RepID=UPI001EF08647|nr:MULTISPECIES: hypothetical protein [unclassified Blastococcus]MCF6506498.1 hypothetical protein [Blastococcus sp. MG754426]MCF6511218.1 hypothetical protein [Blastococcus sp. MG754427]MCF6734494.1 hypothetical protein [Blastococcus sp. KM273129]
MSRPARRPSPTLYLALGAMWALLAAGGLGTSGDGVVTLLFALLAVANLGVGAWLLRKQRRTGAAGR